MAFDQLARMPLPCFAAPGQRLIWLDAGAYHASWKLPGFTRGHAAVVWRDESGFRLVAGAAKL
jgi:diaminopimelate decarboxylase